jgi:hypothetical protein
MVTVASRTEARNVFASSTAGSCPARGIGVPTLPAFLRDCVVGSGLGRPDPAYDDYYHLRFIISESRPKGLTR